jgi:hypothetical protein
MTNGQLPRESMRIHEKVLRSCASRQETINFAKRLAHQLDGVCVDAVLALPIAHITAEADSQHPDTRDREFDVAIEGLIALFYDKIAKQEAHEATVARNARVPRPEVRERVLQHLNNDEIHNVQKVAYALQLSQYQVADAFEHIASLGGLETLGERNSGGRGHIFWIAKLNARGRDLAEGRMTLAESATPVFVQTFHNSNIANAGTVHGSVTQNVTNNPDVRALVGALQEFRKRAGENNEVASAAALAECAEQELRTKGLTARVRSFFKGIGETAKAAKILKPAYEFLQPIAVAHGIDLPELPE